MATCSARLPLNEISHASIAMDYMRLRNALEHCRASGRCTGEVNQVSVFTSNSSSSSSPLSPPSPSLPLLSYPHPTPPQPHAMASRPRHYPAVPHVVGGLCVLSRPS